MSKSAKSPFAAPPPKYRDEPSASTDAISLRTDPGDSYDDRLDVPSEQPPAYTDDAAAVARPPPPGEQERHSFKVIEGVPVLMNERLDNDPAYLEETLQSFAPTPPQPLVKIKGTHRETRVRRDSHGKNSSHSETVVDFDVTLDLTPYLLNNATRTGNTFMQVRTIDNDVKGYRGTVLKRRMLGWKVDAERSQPKPELREWCHRYCASSAHLKNFRFSRKVVGLDTKLLESRLRSLVYSTNYKGHVSISFPVSNQYVDIYSSTAMNRWRTNWWARFVFYITLLFIFAWPYLFFATKRYAVLEAIWPFSLPDRDGRTSYVTVSEERWFQTWKRAIERAILGKEKRTLNPQDLIDAEQGPRDFRSGSETVDGVVGFLTAGIRGASEVNRQLGWGYDC